MPPQRCMYILKVKGLELGGQSLHTLKEKAPEMGNHPESETGSLEETREGLWDGAGRPLEGSRLHDMALIFRARGDTSCVKTPVGSGPWQVLQRDSVAFWGPYPSGQCLDRLAATVLFGAPVTLT